MALPAGYTLNTPPAPPASAMPAGVPAGGSPAAAASTTPPAATTNNVPSGYTLDSHGDQPEANTRSFWDTVSDVGKAAWEGSGGQTIVDLLGGASRDPTAAAKSTETLQRMVQGVRDMPANIWGELGKSGAAMVHGDASGAAYHLAGAVPVVGAGAQQVGDDAAKGDYAKGFGHAIGLLGPFIAPEVLAKLKDVPLSPALASKANPKVTAALDYLETKGVPANAAAKTGNSYVKQVQKLADATPLGAAVANQAEQTTTSALRSEASDLVQRATPAVPSDTLYSQFRTAEAAPANLKQVQTGTRQAPVLNVQGNPIPGQMQSVPVTEKIALPVKVGDLKPGLQKIYDEMSWMPAADRNTSAGYRAIEKILNGPDYVSASEAELGLSGIKALGREGAGRSAGMAKFITPQLQDLVDKAAATGGPDVVKALQQGRIAAASEIGKDWLQKTFDKAQAEGGFGREAGIWADWQRLKPAQKVTLFRSPGLVGDLDKFFLGAKKLAENPNPSGSGLISWVAGQSALAVTHPVSGIPYVLGGGVLSKLLHSQAGVRALTEGMKLSLDSTAPAAAQAAKASQILKLAGPDAKPAAPLPQAAESTDQSPQSAPLATAIAPQ